MLKKKDAPQTKKIPQALISCPEEALMLFITRKSTLANRTGMCLSDAPKLEAELASLSANLQRAMAAQNRSEIKELMGLSG
jgi:hypothetical protein